MKQSFAFSLLWLIVFVNDWSWGFVVKGPGFHGEELRSEVGRCETHFEMKLISSGGEWECYVHYGAEDATAVLPDNNCEKVTWFEEDTNGTTIQFEQPMTLSTDESLTIGHQNGHYTDFFSVLMVTMTQKPNHDDPSYKRVITVKSDLVKRGTIMDSPPPKMCVFYIGASGPGEPVFYAHGFHNASCTLEEPKYEAFEFILTAK